LLLRPIDVVCRWEEWVLGLDRRFFCVEEGKLSVEEKLRFGHTAILPCCCLAGNNRSVRLQTSPIPN
jgi:hypothetical protein